MDIYRYTSFQRLSDLVKDSALTLVNPFTKWEDTHEGLFYTALDDQIIFDTLVRNTSHRNDSKNELDKLKSLLSHATSGLRAQSWSLNGDSIEMWSAYTNNGETIMIQSNLDQLEAMLGYNYGISVSDHPNGTIMPIWDRVIYDIECDDDMCSYIISLFERTTTSIKPLYPLLHKRVSFAFENEVRIFAADSSNSRQTIPLFIEDVTRFISGIMVHPSAEAAFVDKVECFCSKNNLVFMGKSKLFSKEMLFEKLLRRFAQ